MAWQYASANVLLLLGCASLVSGGWAPFVVIALIMVFGSFADEISGDALESLSDSARTFFDFNLYLSLPLICLLTVLLALYAAAHPGFGAQPLQLIGAIWVVGYLYALVGATVGHELTHRQNRLAQLVAHVLLGFTGNASFVIYHVHVHHRQVGTYDDASTARRGERLRTFVARTLIQQFAQAARVEAARLKRRGLPVWSFHNRLIVAHLAPLLILAVVAVIGGPFAVLVVFLAGLLGRLLHELINYVQHFGLVREDSSPIRPHHSWDSYRRISNVLHYNLPRHSDHHMFATKPFWRLDALPDAPMLPYGYQTMAFIALTPPLWRHIMRGLLQEWDERYASEAEREIVRARGWEGLA
jgi:fatty acid desaturase